LHGRGLGPTLVAPKGSRVLRTGAAIAPSRDTFLAEADKFAADLERHAIRKGLAAAWIGLDWLGDSEVALLAPLGADLYNGVSGIGLFLAAHAAVTGSKS
jgi:lantibiotic modifying enzyme